MDIAWVYQRDAEEVTVREDEQNKPDIKPVSYTHLVAAILKKYKNFQSDWAAIHFPIHSSTRKWAG